MPIGSAAAGHHRLQVVYSLIPASSHVRFIKILLEILSIARHHKVAHRAGQHIRADLQIGGGLLGDDVAFMDLSHSQVTVCHQPVRDEQPGRHQESHDHKDVAGPLHGDAVPVAPPLQNGFPLTACSRFFLLLPCRLRLLLRCHLPSRLTQERREFLRRNGWREEITLYQITPDLLQHLHLFLGLHAFGHHRRGQVPCDLDDDLQHVGILLLSEGRADELHIQLQHINWQRGQHIQ